MAHGNARILLLVGCILSPAVVGSSDSVPPPAAAFALAASTAGTVVYWLPVAEPDVSYRVYGSSGGELLLLSETDAPSDLVPAGYAGYAVTSVLNGVESAPTYAPSTFCVSPSPSPPFFTIRTNCSTGVYGSLIIPRP